jgi:hypothetical protein
VFHPSFLERDSAVDLALLANRSLLISAFFVMFVISLAYLSEMWLTTVASSCERKEPITATDVIFQTKGSSRSDC